MFIIKLGDNDMAKNTKGFFKMEMLASGSVFAFRDAGVKNHADGKDYPGFYQADSFSAYSGGWTQNNLTDKSGNHWTKRTVRNAKTEPEANITILNTSEAILFFNMNISSFIYF